MGRVPWATQWCSALLCSVVTTLGAGGSVAGQTIEGTIVESTSGAAIPGTLIRLIDGDSAVLATTIADSIGAYQVSFPSPGAYRVLAERLGYQALLTPLVSASNPDGAYALDLELHVDPVAMEGIVVTAQRQAQVLESIRTIVGLNIRSLSRQPILRETVYNHVERGHSIPDMIRWTPGAHIIIRQEDDGPCFLFRGRHCLPVYLDGDRLLRNIIEVVPLDMVHAAVILTPNETVQYPGGAILLFTEGWLR